MKARMLQYGFEIEGEYSEQLMKAIEQYGSVKLDGSVNNCDGGDCGELSTQEFATTPIDINKRMPKLWQIFYDSYERGGYHWNDSAGFHVHISFKPTMPPELLSRQFCDYFYKEMKAKYPKEYLARRNNSYCKEQLDTTMIYQRHNDRYHGINIMPSIVRHGTIEFRIFPANSPYKMYSYLRFILRTVKKFLSIEIKEVMEIEPETIEDGENILSEDVIKVATKEIIANV